MSDPLRCWRSRPPSDRYKEWTRIGGNLGCVYQVNDALLNRPVALKTLLSANHDPASLIKEGSLQATLLHPNIMPVLDCGVLPVGGEERPFFTMPWYASGTLEKRVGAVHEASMFTKYWSSSGGWDLFRLLDAVTRVSEALAFAHKRGVIHRDIKPANVVVGEAYGDVVLADWGLACASSTTQRPTSPQAFAQGTKGFIAPELTHSPGAPPNERSDVYSLGALLYTVLCGKAPSEAPNGAEIPLAETPLFIPREMAELVSDAMQADPNERLPEARELADRLRRYLSDSGAGRTILETLSRQRALLRDLEDTHVYPSRGSRASVRFDKPLELPNPARPPELFGTRTARGDGDNLRFVWHHNTAGFPNAARRAELEDAWLKPLKALLVLHPNNADILEAILTPILRWMGEAEQKGDAGELARLSALLSSK